MATREGYSIVGGPSAHDLSVSLFHEAPYGSCKHRIPVNFQLETAAWPASLHSAIITGAKEKDRQKGLWRLEMLISEVTHEGNVDQETTLKAVANYSTKTREGKLYKIGRQPLEQFLKLFIRTQDVGECEIDVKAVVERWKNLWCISQWGEDEFRFCDGQFKCTISKDQAKEIISAVGLIAEQSPVFNSGKTWRIPM